MHHFKALDRKNLRHSKAYYVSMLQNFVIKCIGILQANKNTRLLIKKQKTETKISIIRFYFL